MARYTSIPTPISSQNGPRRYSTVKYPEIPLDFSDVYVYTTRGDRYDILAVVYYGNPELWWVIAAANPQLGYDSLIPPYGSQLRIPSFNRVNEIQALFDSLNQ